MRISENSFEMVHQLRFINAAKRGGVESQRLQFLMARAEGLPDGMDALVVTSDLQGVAPSWRHGGENVLLGVQVAEELCSKSLPMCSSCMRAHRERAISAAIHTSANALRLAPSSGSYADMSTGITQWHNSEARK